MRRLILSLTAVVVLAVPMVAVSSGHTAAAAVFGGCSTNTGGSSQNYTQAQKQGQTDVCGDAQSQGAKQNPIINIIKVAINVISFLVGIAAVITIVVSGLRMIFSGGDSQAVASARTGLIFALAGLAVVALAQALVAFVLDKVQ